jgi:hypothetical protein
MEPINDPLPWYIAGPLIGLFVPAFLLLAGRELGISSSFRHACAALLPGGAKKKIPYLNYNWIQEGGWQLTFVAGLIFGGVVTHLWLGGAGIPLLAPNAAAWDGALPLFLGGILVGFGTRWADGCTSGHTINGISQLQFSSLIASICFVVGGVAASFVHRIFFGGLIP